MANTLWMEAGSEATQGFEFWDTATPTGTGATLTSDSQAIAGSSRSIKCFTGSTNSGRSGPTKLGILHASHNRGSIWWRFNGNYHNNTDILTFRNNFLTSVFWIARNSDGKISVTAASGAAVGFSASAIPSDVDTRISWAFTFTSLTVNTIEVYINGVLEINLTNVDMSAAGLLGSFASIFVGLVGDDQPANANCTAWFTHIFLDDGSTGDIGDVRVDVRRPFANGTINGFTGSGTPSGYGTGNARYVNEQPLNASNFTSVAASGSAVTEEYSIDGPDLGFILDYMAWIYAKSLTSETGQIIAGGATSSISLTSTATFFSKLKGSLTYPPRSGADVGIVTSTTVTTVTLYEAGILVARIYSRVNTVSKRSSAFDLNMPWRINKPFPDNKLTVADRVEMALFYNGFNSNAIETQLERAFRGISRGVSRSIV